MAQNLTSTPQRWAVIVVWVSALSGLSPVLWRVHMLMWGAGWELAPEYRSSSILVIYVAGLCIAEAAASLLTFGLIRPWGEIWPRWFPFFGGRRIPVGVVTAVAGLGATVLTATVFLTLSQMVMMSISGISNPILQTHGWHRWFLIAHYAPWPLWPIGLWAAIIAYAKRRRSRGASSRQ